MTDIYYNGSEKQWNSVSILDNEELTIAVIHYLIDDCFFVSNGTVKNTDLIDKHVATVIILKYTDGVFVGFEKCEEVKFATGETKTFTVPENGKLFVRDSLNGMKPLSVN